MIKETEDKRNSK